MTWEGVIPTNALSPAKEAVTLPASMLPNSAAKDSNMISPFYSSYTYHHLAIKHNWCHGGYINHIMNI
jgi:hypothetical protein